MASAELPLHLKLKRLGIQEQKMALASLDSLMKDIEENFALQEAPETPITTEKGASTTLGDDDDEPVMVTAEQLLSRRAAPMVDELKKTGLDTEKDKGSKDKKKEKEKEKEKEKPKEPEDDDAHLMEIDNAIAERLRAQLDKERKRRTQGVEKEEKKDDKKKLAPAPSGYDEFRGDDEAQKAVNRPELEVEDDDGVPHYGDDLSSEDEGPVSPPPQQRRISDAPTPMSPPKSPALLSPISPSSRAISGSSDEDTEASVKDKKKKDKKDKKEKKEKKEKKDRRDRDSAISPKPSQSSDVEFVSDEEVVATIPVARRSSSEDKRPTSTITQTPAPTTSTSTSPTFAALRRPSEEEITDLSNIPVRMSHSESISGGLLLRGSVPNLATNKRPLGARPSYSPYQDQSDELTQALAEAERDVLEWRLNFRQTTGRFPSYRDVIEDRSKKDNIRTKLKNFRDIRRKKLASAKPF